MNALVVPTIRENCINKFLKEWEVEKFDEIIIIEDNPTKSFNLGIKHHYSWKEIKEDLGDSHWIISKRDSAIRCYGYLIAYRLNADYIITLDDDCYPQDLNFISTHIEKLCNTPKWTESILGLRTEGLPYKNLGKLENVVLNMGLWTNVPDLDGINQLVNPIPDFYPQAHDRVMPKSQYFPMCGMNMAFIRQVVPMLYFPLMGEGQPYKRFDDIFAGIIFKKICDHLGYYITCGHPYVKHNKASDPFVNLIKEAPGILENETFWELIDKIPLHGKTPKECMNEISAHLEFSDAVYQRQLGTAIKFWLNCF